MSNQKNVLPKIEAKDPNELIPYANNAKIHPDEQILKIASQINSFGFDQPIVIDANNVIIKGHGRREAALRLGLKIVPVIVSTLDEYQAMASRMADNKVAISDIEDSKLAFDLGTLDRMGFDLSLTAFDDFEIKDILEGWETDIGLVNKVAPSLSGIVGKIVISCPADSREELKKYIVARIEEHGFENVEVE